MMKCSSIEFLIHCDITYPIFKSEISKCELLTNIYVKRVFQKGGLKVYTQKGNLQLPFSMPSKTLLPLVSFIGFHVLFCFNIFSYKFYPKDKNRFCINLKIFIATVLSLIMLNFMILNFIFLFLIILLFPWLEMLPYTFSFLKIVDIITYDFVQSRM